LSLLLGLPGLLLGLLPLLVCLLLQDPLLLGLLFSFPLDLNELMREAAFA